MKTGIHPAYYIIEVVCACGNKFTTRSTKKELKLEICGACHPVFTGKQKFIDSEGRIDKFLKKFDQAKRHTKQVKEEREAVKIATAKAAVLKAKLSPTAKEGEKKPAKKPKILSTTPVTKKS